MVGKGPARRGRAPLVSPLCNEKWTLDPNKKALYPSALEMVRLISDELGFNKGELSLHSARNFLPTCASQLGWGLDDRRKVGHWAPGSEMPDKYDRAFCVTELRLRDNIFPKLMVAGPPQYRMRYPGSLRWEIPKGPRLTPLWSARRTQPQSHPLKRKTRLQLGMQPNNRMMTHPQEAFPLNDWENSVMWT